MSIKAPTIGVEKAHIRPTGLIRSFSPPGSSLSWNGLGSLLSQIVWKDCVVSNRISKLWALELLCAYLVRDSQERARGVGKQPQPMQGGMRKSFIIFHKVIIGLDLSRRQADDGSWFWHKVSRIDLLLLLLYCYCYPSKRGCRNQHSPDAAMLPFGIWVLGCK